MDTTMPAAIARLSPDEAMRALDDLATLLHACVHAGASVSFVLPFSVEDARGFWMRKVFPAVGSGALLLLAAKLGGRLAGSVQLDLDTPPNQPHRAEIRKLLVHPDFRRRGLATGLMTAVEREAAGRGRRLLTLDTRTGDAAEPLYSGLGYATAGVIPGFSRDPASDRLDATTIMFKTI